jgi:predicted dehydrogenase
MSDKIRVGIIGASPDRGWAATAHIPALRSLPEYELTAVGTSRAASARQAAARFGAAHWFTDAEQLAGDPDVDLVVITVKVPFHRELTEAALGAGKHVLVEWPLARTTEEAEGLARLGARAGVRHAVGLQARFAPAVNYARELIAGGYVGRVTSANVLVARGKGAGAVMPGWTAYTLNRDNGAGVLEVSGGHTLDALEYVTGGRLTGVSARLSVQRPAYTIEGTGERAEVTSPDQILLHAALDSGAMVSAHIHDAKLTSGRTRLEIAGTDGDLVIETTGAQAQMGIQISDLRLAGSRGPGGTYQDLTVPDRFRHAPAGLPADAVLNVAELYARLARDIRDGGPNHSGPDHSGPDHSGPDHSGPNYSGPNYSGPPSVPDFGDAIRAHRLLDAIRSSRQNGDQPG